MAHVARENNKRRNWPQKRQQEDAVSVAFGGPDMGKYQQSNNTKPFCLYAALIPIP